MPPPTNRPTDRPTDRVDSAAAAAAAARPPCCAKIESMHVWPLASFSPSFLIKEGKNEKGEKKTSKEEDERRRNERTTEECGKIYNAKKPSSESAASWCMCTLDMVGDIVCGTFESSC